MDDKQNVRITFGLNSEEALSVAVNRLDCAGDLAQAYILLDAIAKNHEEIKKSLVSRYTQQKYAKFNAENPDQVVN